MNTRRTFCATCLSQGREMFPLPLIDMKDMVHFYNDLKLCRLDKICWECRNFVLKMARFKCMARKAQSNLADMLRKKETSLQSLSKLKTSRGISLDIAGVDLQQEREPGQTPEVLLNSVKQETDTEFTEEAHNEVGDMKIDAAEAFNVTDDTFEVFEHVIWKPPKTMSGNVIGVFEHKILPPESSSSLSADAVQDANGIANATLMTLLNRKSNQLPIVPTLEDTTLENPKQKSHIPEIIVEKFTLEVSQESKEVSDSEDQKPSFIEERLTEEERVKWWASKKEMKFYTQSIEVFRCEKCVEPFFTRRSFLGHKKMHTEVFGKLSCDICQLRFNNDKALRLHKDTHYRLLKCTRCTHAWDTPNSMRRHCDIEHSAPVAVWNCDVCPRELPTYGRYLGHLRSHSHKECPRCGKMVYVTGLKTHMKTHRGGKTREEILEAKRIASKLRYERIKSDPILSKEKKEYAKKLYLKRKQTKKVAIVENIEELREKWRKNSSAYYRRKKMAKELLHVNLNGDDVKSVVSREENENDPLSS